MQKQKKLDSERVRFPGVAISMKIVAISKKIISFM